MQEEKNKKNTEEIKELHKKEEDIDYCDNCGIVLTNPYICRSCGQKTALCEEEDL